jgi:hypothetical protein
MSVRVFHCALMYRGPISCVVCLKGLIVSEAGYEF